MLNKFTNRLANNLKTDVILRIDDFCDTNDNEYVRVDLTLNRGGMGVNLMYIDDNMNDNTSGYWMIIGNNYNT